MSYPLLHMLFYFLFLLLPFPSVAQPNGAIALGATITATYEATTPWLSPSQDFAFGFKQLNDNDLFLLSIWYYKIPDQTIVWSANQGVPLAVGSKVEITADKGLVLLDPQGKEWWISDQIPDQVAYGFMDDTGNFVLVSRDTVNLWESFNYPTDTMLPTQVIESGGVIYSRQSEKNFSRGSTQIIHCDIKPQNILLDDYYNARISDLGLAKLLMINQSQTNTGIRRTKGYVAPEWFRSKLVTAKVDVYSFGVVLLEIITYRKNVGDWEMGEEERETLIDWVCDCFVKERLDALVENDSEALHDWRKLERFLMVGIWCIEEDPSLRPTMRKVAQMLEGVVEVSVPPCPSQFLFHG